MFNYKIDRICEDIKREISNILLNIKDPQINHRILTILKVHLSRDLSFAKVYISSMDGLEGTSVVVKRLNVAKGFIKKNLALRLKIRKIPDLEFIADNSIEDSINMFKKLEK